MVQASQKLDVPIVEITRQVPCLVQTVALPTAEGIVDEFLNRQLRAIQVPSGDLDATNVQFS